MAAQITGGFYVAVELVWFSTVRDVLARKAASLGLQPPTPNGFKTDRQRATLFGQSQGAGSAPLALTVSPAQGGFRNAYLNSPGGGLMYNEYTIRGDLRPLFDWSFQFEAGEFDRFHPIAQLLQMALEVGSPANHADRVSTDSLLITAGFDDGCATRESTAALATRLARFGKLEAADTRAAYTDDSAKLAFIDQFLPTPRRALPASGNLSTGKTGLYLLLPGHHTVGDPPDLDPSQWTYPVDERGGLFLHYLGYSPTLIPYVGPLKSDEQRGHFCTTRVSP